MLGNLGNLSEWFLSNFVILLIAMFAALADLATALAPFVGWAIQTLLLYAILVALKKRPWR